MKVYKMETYYRLEEFSRDFSFYNVILEQTNLEEARRMKKFLTEKNLDYRYCIIEVTEQEIE